MRNGRNVVVYVKPQKFIRPVTSHLAVNLSEHTLMLTGANCLFLKTQDIYLTLMLWEQNALIKYQTTFWGIDEKYTRFKNFKRMAIPEQFAFAFAFTELVIRSFTIIMHL